MRRIWRSRLERWIPLYAEGLLSDRRRRRLERALASDRELASSLRRYERVFGAVKSVRPLYPAASAWDRVLPALRSRVSEMDEPQGWYPRLIRRLYDRLESRRAVWSDYGRAALWGAAAGAVFGAAALLYAASMAPDPAGSMAEGALEAEEGDSASTRLALEERFKEGFEGPFHLISDPSDLSSDVSSDLSEE